MKNLKNALLLKHLYQLKNLGYRYTNISPCKEEEPDLTLPNTLENLREEAHNCQLCQLSKHRDKVVFGEGNPNAKLMIVGDLPSNSDNSRGKIFTDRAGDLLDKMLQNVLGLSRQDVYITNILKCYPLDTQNPSPTYTHTCYPYLQKEIALVKPKVILALGELSHKYLLEEQGDIKIIPTYHPSYLLRNDRKKKEVFEALKKVKAFI